MDIKVYFSDNLHFLRKRKGLTLAGVGKLVGKSYNAIYHWEHKMAEPTIADIFVLANYFDVPVTTLLYEDITIMDYPLSKK